MKIGVIGAGNVGASVAYALAMRQTCEELVLLDIFADVARAKAIDIAQAACVFSGSPKVAGGDDYSLLKDADIVVITAGSPRKEGQSREDLLLKNAVVVAQSARNTAKYAPNAIIIVVTNPLDVMVWTAREASGFETRRVIGMAGELDSARCRYEISQLKGADAKDISAKVIGAHNDKMIVASQNININLETAELEKVVNETKNGGAKIVKLLKTSAYYAPAAAVTKMCEAIKDGSGEILSVSVLLEDGLACGRKVTLKRDGLGEILPLNLDESALAELTQSEDEIRKNILFVKENFDKF